MYPYYFISPFYDKYNVYKPVYDDRVDYQTNAKSYYDYLARYNKELVEIENFINRLLKRDLQVSDTDTINLVKKGNWLSDDCCRYDDIIRLQSNVKISSHITLKFLEATKKQYELNNAIQVYSDGLYVPNLLNLITALDNEIVELQNAIKKINQEITNIYQDIKNINKEITNIKNDITNIYNQLSAITGAGDFKKMVKGKDYNIIMYNGYYNKKDNDFLVGYLETQNGVVISIRNTHDPEYTLLNNNITNVKLSHSTPLSTIPEAKIFTIEFIGDFKKYNNYNVVALNQQGSNIWNIRPLNLRASWTMFYKVDKKLYSTQAFTFATVSYADGYNTQFSEYNNDKMSLISGNFFCTLNLIDPNAKEEEETEEENKEEGTQWRVGLQEMLSQNHQ